jgi:acyl carrier protein
MTDPEVLQVFAEILGDLLGQDVRLTLDTERGDVSGWDSFNYVNFIVAVEMRCGVQFKVAEIESFENVGAIVRRLQTLKK